MENLRYQKQMGAGKKTQTFIIRGSGPPGSNPISSFASARNLSKSNLGGIIFGCTDSTINECLTNQLFGLPAEHLSYVKNIDPGLPLFLFNYTDRKLHGIFEAASNGKLNINPYGWVTDGSRRTQYPAQVQVCVRRQCQPLSEGQFKPIIADNYYKNHKFWFELDHAQTSKLLSLLASPALALPSAPVPQITPMLRSMFKVLPPPDAREEDEGLAFESEHSNRSSRKSASLDADNQPMDAYFAARVTEQKEKDLIYMKLKELVTEHEQKDSFVVSIEDSAAVMNDVNLKDPTSEGARTGLEEKNGEAPPPSDNLSVHIQLIQEIEELKAFKAEQTHKSSCLEQKLFEADKEIQLLKKRFMRLVSSSASTLACDNQLEFGTFDERHMDATESIYLVGGYDGNTWLSALDLYFPTHNVTKSLRPMSSIRSYASVAQLDGELYVFGGGTGFSWYDIVESYNPAYDEWTARPSLNKKRGSLAGAVLNGKIFAIGGADEFECFSDVEMLDLDIGRWVYTQSMLQKRFSLSAVELNGVIYATGGYDGINYLTSAERFDPREHSWSKIASMNSRRASHSLVVLNDKLYALGGFDGSSMVPSIEILDPRVGKWMIGEPMNQERGYSAAAVVKDFIYIMGGLKEEEGLVYTVECYNESLGWQEINSNSVGPRSFFSAITI